MSSGQNWIFIQNSIFIHRCMSSSCSLSLVVITLRKRVFVCHQPGLSQYNTVRITVCSKFLFYPKLVVCHFVYLPLRTSVCGAALWPCTLPAHVSLFILTSCQCDNGSLWVCLHFQHVLTGRYCTEAALVLISSPVFIPLCGLLYVKQFVSFLLTCCVPLFNLVKFHAVVSGTWVVVVQQGHLTCTPSVPLIFVQTAENFRLLWLRSLFMHKCPKPRPF